MRHGTIVWVEIPVRDLRHAADFYAGLFGWSFEPDEDNRRWIFAPPGRGAMGSITTSLPTGSGGVRIIVEVDNAQSAAHRAISLGGGATSESRTTAVGKSVDVVDPDGNHLWLYQAEPKRAGAHEPVGEGAPKL
jgi:predicted enzyme related to lactoylglutathione lyase